MAAILELANVPRPQGCRKLVGSRDRWRIRIGDYRVIYSIEDGGQLVTVLYVRHRSEAYD
jgi:mRNA interferase RelE/StbE